MTENIYQKDAYKKEFQATIEGINKEHHGVLLSRTAFYPGGGGQPKDRGIIDIDGISVPVIGFKRTNRGIVHLLSKDSSLPNVNSIALGMIDWQYRYDLMRTHTAMHILSAIGVQDYDALVTGGNMQPLKFRIDFEMENLSKEMVSSIEHRANTEVDASREIKISFLDRESANKTPELIRTKVNLIPDFVKVIRVVEIEGLDMQADGGTHVTNTSEIGKILISDYKSKGKNNKRIYGSLNEKTVEQIP